MKLGAMMTEQKLTPWFARGVKPRRTGVYETRSYPGDKGLYQFWNGRYFSYSSVTVNGAYAIRDFESAYQNEEWRGIAK